MVVVNMCFLSSCSSIQYKKFDTTRISLPNNLEEAFKNTTIEQIEWYLASSKDWEFTKTRENTMARYISGEISEPYVKITVFTQGFFETGAKYEQNQTIDLDSEMIDVDIYKRQKSDKGVLGSDRYFSSVTIQFSEVFFVRFDEYSYDLERNMTVSAINEIFKLFADGATQRNELCSNGSIKSEHVALKIEGNKYGTYDISGFVHLSKKNVCRIKIVDPVTNEVYFDQLSDDKSQFYVGWSDNESDCFSFYQRLTIRKKANGPGSADVIIQLWVDDADGSRCVLEMAQNITFWVR